MNENAGKPSITKTDLAKLSWKAVLVFLSLFICIQSSSFGMQVSFVPEEEIPGTKTSAGTYPQRVKLVARYSAASNEILGRREWYVDGVKVASFTGTNILGKSYELDFSCAAMAFPDMGSHTIKCKTWYLVCYWRTDPTPHWDYIERGPIPTPTSKSCNWLPKIKISKNTKMVAPLGMGGGSLLLDYTFPSIGIIRIYRGSVSEENEYGAGALVYPGEDERSISYGMLAEGENRIIAVATITKTGKDPDTGETISYTYTDIAETTIYGSNDPVAQYTTTPKGSSYNPDQDKKDDSCEEKANTNMVSGSGSPITYKEPGNYDNINVWKRLVYPDGRITPWVKIWACPDSLPAAKGRVALRMVLGADSVGKDWTPAIQFSPVARMNYLDKIRLELPVQYYGTVGQTDWHRNATASIGLVDYLGRVPTFDYYSINPGANKWLPSEYGEWNNSYLEFSTENGVEYLKLVFPRGDYIKFEQSDAGQNWGRDFRAIERVNAYGEVNTIQYNLTATPPNVTVVDGDNNQHICQLDANNNITSIAIAGRNWTYSGTTSSITETHPTGVYSTYSYDTSNRMTQWLESDGTNSFTTQYFYDATSGQQTRVLYTSGAEQRETLYSWDDTNHETTITWADGNMSKEAFDDHSVTYTDGLGNTYVKEYINGKLLKEVDQNGNMTRYEYDIHEQLTRTVYPDNTKETLSYDTSGNMTARSAPGISATYSYDSNNLLTQEVFNGEITTYQLDSNGLRTKIIDALSRETLYQYNSMGKVTRIETPEGVVNQYTYDTWGNRISHINGHGKITYYYYDVANRITKIKDPLNNETTFSYDWKGRKTQQQDPEGNITTWQYDPWDNCTQISGAAGGSGGCTSCGSASGSTGSPGKYFYNSVNKLIKFTDLRNTTPLEPENDTAKNDPYSTYYEYDSAWRLTRVKDARAYESSMSYDPTGNMTLKNDPNTNSVSFEYDNMNRLAVISNSKGTTQFSYDTAGRQTSVIDAVGAQRTSEYDSTGHMTKSTNPLGTATSYEYDAVGNQTKTTLADGGAVLYYYDTDNRLTRTVNQLSGETKQYYDINGQLTKTENELSAATLIYYDDAGRLTRVTNPLGAETVYEYDDDGRRTKTIDPVGRWVLYTLNSFGNPTAISNSAGESVQLFYDEVQNRTKVIDVQGIQTEYFFDATSNITRTLMAGTIEQTALFDGVGNMLQSSDAASKTTYYEYDGTNQLTQITNPESEETTHAYDAVGRRTSVSLANGSARTFNYDMAGHLIQSSGGPDGKTTYHYDALGRQKSIVDANGRARRNYYDVLGRVIKASNEMGQPVRYEYDIAGHRTKLIDAKDNTTFYVFDDAGNLLSMTYANGDQEVYAYDSSGLITKKTSADGKVLNYSYDNAGRLATINTSDGTVTYNRSNGVLASISGPTTTMSYEYDTLGRITGVTDSALNKTVTYAYDTRGLRTQMTLPNSTVVSYGYDDAMRLSTVQKTGESNPTVYAYDGGGRRTSLTLPNGVVTNYQYDSNDRLLRLGTQKSGTTIASFNYTLDAVGNRKGIALANGDQIAYEYDRAYRLKREVRRNQEGIVYDEQFFYDAVGNRTRKLYEATTIVGESLSASWPFTTGGSAFEIADSVLSDDSNTVLLLHLEESDQAVDSSSYNNDGTLVGGVTPHAEGWFGDCLSFDGVDDSVSITDSTSLNLSDSNFTIDAWVNTQALADGRTILSKWGTANCSYKLSVNNGKLEMTLSGDGVAANATSISGQTELVLGMWYHVAVTRDGDTIRLFLNGNEDGKGTFRGALYSGTATLLIGASSITGSEEWFLGKIDEVRVSNSCRYESKPTLDISGNGNNGALIGDARICPSGKFDNGLRLGGDAGGVEIADNSSIELGNSNFTIEAWINQDNVTGYQCVVSKWIAQSTSYSLSINNGKLELRLSTDGGEEAEPVTLTGETSIVAQTWTHVAAVREGNEIRLYVDGKEDASSEFTGTLYDGSSSVSIGVEDIVSMGKPFVGMIDDVRISAVARYPVAATPDSSGNELNAKLHGDTLLVTEGKSKKALGLDGDGDYAEIGDNALLDLGAADFRISAYINPINVVGEKCIISKWADAGNRSYRLRLDGNLVKFDISGDGEEFITLASTATVVSSAWTEIEVRRVADKLTLYVDGEADSSMVYGGAVFDSSTPLRFGASSETGSELYFLGMIDEALVARAPVATAASGETLYHYNNVNQLVRETGGDFVKHYAYDPAGNNTQIVTTGTGAGMVTMGYDSLGRMTNWSDGTNTETTTYRGAEWHRDSITVGGVTTNYLYDGDNVVVDYSGGSMTRMYVTPFLDQNLSMTDVAGGNTYYYNHDGLGNVRNLTDATGATVNSYGYTAFGQPYAPNTAVSLSQRYTYTGREQSPLASFGAPMYYRYRTYDPSIGRFIRRDPINYFGNPNGNLYLYVNNKPTVFIDPSGLMNIGTMGDREIAGWLLEIPKFKEQRIECQKQCYSIVKTPGNKKQLCMAAKCLKNCQAAYEAKCLFANKWINYWRTYDALDIAVERLANQKSLTTEQMLLLARTETNSPIIFSGLGTRKVNVIVDPNGGRSIFDPVSYSMKIGMVPLPISITVTTAVSNVSPRVAFRMAKIDAGVARSQQPILTRNVALTYQNGKAIITANGRALMSREYIFRNQYGNTVVIQRHGYGHSFSGGVTEPPHFNVRPIEDLRHGVVMGTKSHYYFEK